MKHKCSNGRWLITTTKESLKSHFLSGDLVPCVALLTAWQSDSSSIRSWESSLRFLLQNGCSYLVCVGPYSEPLHDAIDEFVYQLEDERVIEQSKNIVTSYHQNESVEEVMAYFVHGTELRRQNGCLVAILNDAPQDREIESFIRDSEAKP